MFALIKSIFVEIVRVFLLFTRFETIMTWNDMGHGVTDSNRTRTVNGPVNLIGEPTISFPVTSMKSYDYLNIHIKFDKHVN